MILLCDQHLSLTAKSENKEKQSLVGLTPGIDFIHIFSAAFEQKKCNIQLFL
jgi:hypothetical protein